MPATIEGSSIGTEIELITQQQTKVHYHYDCLLHVGNEDIAPYKMTRMLNTRDFVQQLTDEQFVDIYLGQGTLMYKVAPYQDNLKFTIIRSPLDENGVPSTDEAVYTRTFRAFLADEPERPLHGRERPDLQDQETADLQHMKVVRLQLMEPAIEQLRLMQIGTIGQVSTPANLAKTLLVAAYSRLNLETDEKPQGLQMTEPNNVEVRKHLPIPDNTGVLELFDLMQHKLGGIYGSGLGFYYALRKFFVWPLYDFNRQQTARKRVTFILAPGGRLGPLDRTWRSTERSTTVLITGTVKVVDNSASTLANQGNGVRFADSRKLMEGFVEVKDNKAIAKRSANNSEFITTTTGTGLNNLQPGRRGQSDNIFAESSRLAERQGAIATLEWRHAALDLLEPDMAVEILFDKGGDVASINGTLLGEVQDVSMVGDGLTSDRYVTRSMVHVFIDRLDPDFRDFLKAGGTKDQPTPSDGF